MKYIALAAISLFITGCGEMKTSELVNEVKNGVVLIENKISESKGGIGTGFILNDNQIVTNLHVVDGSGVITVYSNETQKKYKAVIVYKDAIADIAILRLYDWDMFEANEHPTNLTLGDSDETKVGDKVVVIGHPWGLTWTVSQGILSAKDRRPGSNPRYLYQVDANLFQGNSGGPIFNEKGQVICVSTLMLAMEGGSYGFCVPSDFLHKVIYDFNTFGEVHWRVLNVAASLTEDGSSVIFTDVEPDGAAGMSGIKQGDKVLEIHTSGNHPREVKITTPNDLITELAKLYGDEEQVKLLIDRNGEKMMIDVKTNYKLSKDYSPDQAK